MSSISKIDRIIKEINSSFEVREDNGLLFLDGKTDNYDEIVLAGREAVTSDHYGVINDIRLEGEKEIEENDEILDYSLDNLHVDCLVIGGGVIGSAILRELSKFKSLLVL